MNAIQLELQAGPHLQEIRTRRRELATLASTCRTSVAAQRGCGFATMVEWPLPAAPERDAPQFRGGPRDDIPPMRDALHRRQPHRQRCRRKRRSVHRRKVRPGELRAEQPEHRCEAATGRRAAPGPAGATSTRPNGL